MFDIFVYIFENYLYAEQCPDADKLARKLAAAGFDDEEIGEAIDWLAGLKQITAADLPAIHPVAANLRIYDESECARLSLECRGFLLFLEQAGALDAACREMIVERTLALPELNLTLARFKVVVLMVLWSRDQDLDTLVLEELFYGEEDEPRSFH